MIWHILFQSSTFLRSYVRNVADLLYWRSLITPSVFCYAIGMSIYCQYAVIVFFFFASFSLRKFLFAQINFVHFWMNSTARIFRWLRLGYHDVDSIFLRLWTWRKYFGTRMKNIKSTRFPLHILFLSFVLILSLSFWILKDNGFVKMLYDSDWYLLPIKNQKVISHLINLQQNSPGLSIGPLAADLNREIFKIVSWFCSNQWSISKLQNKLHHINEFRLNDIF